MRKTDGGRLAKILDNLLYRSGVKRHGMLRAVFISHSTKVVQINLFVAKIYRSLKRVTMK